MDALLALTTDRLALRKLGTVAAALELELAPMRIEDFRAEAAPPAALVVDLEAAGALEAVADFKRHHPRTLAAGFVTFPSDELWRAAEDAGCDLVTTRGALANRLPAKVAEWRRRPGGRRVRLVDLRDVAGRVGVVARLPDSPVGPLAVYHLAGEVIAVQDACPHAGAALSAGELDTERAIVTCPRHGSRFDLRSGDRVRGPADDGVATYRVVVEDSHAYLQLE